MYNIFWEFCALEVKFFIFQVRTWLY